MTRTDVLALDNAVLNGACKTLTSFYFVSVVASTIKETVACL